MDKKRLNIGLFICHLDNDYAYEICKGVDFACKELDANLIIFPGMYINAAYSNPQKARFDYQYNSIFYYASKENLDALIVSMGTIGSFLSQSDLQAFLDNFKDIPLLTIEIPVNGYESLYIEGKTGLKKAIEHLIVDHNKKKIGFVGGRQFNADAVERLNTYKETLTEHGLPVEDSLIVHGNFSEYCEDLVEELLDNNPDIDAMVFANDQMALGGYNVFKRRGIVVGKDLAVVGYDDAPISLTLDPPLTTVKASSSDMGYYAAYEVLNMIKYGKTFTKVLNSDLIIRKSCGCKESSINDFSNLDNIISLDNVEKISDRIVTDLLRDFSSSFIRDSLNKAIGSLFKEILTEALDDDIKIFSTDNINKHIDNIVNSKLIIYYGMSKLIYLFTEFNKIVLSLIHDSEKQINYCTTINAIFSRLTSTCSSNRYNDKKEYKINIWSSSYIIRDTLTYGKDDDECFKLMMDTISGLPFKNSYIYLYNNPVQQSKNGSWKIPDYLLLQAFNDNHEQVVLTGNNRNISSSQLFTNKYMPTDRRYTMVLTPVFTNEQQHGIFMCEVDIADFHNVYSTSLQLGTALKFLSMLREQIATQNKLVLSIQEVHDKNQQLNHLSTSDGLTGLYNRRGFLEKAQTFINDELHLGKKAIIVFADMDNLKMVNDKFGHKNGDFALINIARILTKSFRTEDVIGRLGGDEFVAFAIVNEDNLASKIQHNIDRFSKELNDNCGKPYYIDMSIGISEFTCSNEVAIEDIMSEADSALYSNKKYKRKSILKNI